MSGTAATTKNAPAGLIAQLPTVRGKYREQTELSKTTWFQVGGPAEVLYKPEDAEDLAKFLSETPPEIPLTVLGVGSNLLVRDGGIEGVVIRLGRAFTTITVEENKVIAGAGAMDVHVAEVAMQYGLSGLEFLSGIPGCIGGALAMNGGAYGGETSTSLLSVEAVARDGTLRHFTVDELQYRYRHCGLLDTHPLIFTRATFRAIPEDTQRIAERMLEIADSRAGAQPIRSRTGGSTFKNPSGQKAWALIDAAGCRGLTIGSAQVSEKHCNFLINTGNATAADIENLGEEVRRRVLDHSGIALEWEIKRVGRAAH